MVAQGESSGNGEGAVDDFAAGIHLLHHAEHRDVVGKLIGGVTAIGVAMMLVPKEDATATKTEAEAQS